MPPAQEISECCEVFWCADAWYMLADLLREGLPSWATLRLRDPTRPLSEQVPCPLRCTCVSTLSSAVKFFLKSWDHKLHVYNLPSYVKGVLTPYESFEVSTAEVLVPTTTSVGEDVIAAAKKLRLVVQPAAGYNNIATMACALRSIPVCTMPGLNAVSTAEAALCCILMLSRRAKEQQESFMRGQIGLPLATQLQGKTLGIVGYGSVGKHLAKIAAAMGMAVLWTNSKSSRASLEDLLRRSDVVSIHCPLTKATKWLIKRTELALMKPGALLVNYARGDILHEEDVTDAVMSGRLGGLGLDVHWVEPADPEKPLYRHPKVLAFPHTGSSTHEVMLCCCNFMVENIANLRSGQPLKHELHIQRDK